MQGGQDLPGSLNNRSFTVFEIYDISIDKLCSQAHVLQFMKLIVSYFKKQNNLESHVIKLFNRG